MYMYMGAAYAQFSFFLIHKLKSCGLSTMWPIYGRCMNRLYLGLFLNFPLMGFFWAFFPYSGHIEETKSVEFASVAVCSMLTQILAENDWTIMVDR